MKRSHVNPSALLNRLEKKYARKVEIEKMKRQAKQQRQSLAKIRGMSVSNLLGKQSAIFDNDFMLTHR